MNLDDKIYIAGHLGLVGSSIVRKLKSRDFANLVMRTHQELDLTNQLEVQNFFQQEKPDYVILAAAKVGGIHANNIYPADFIYQNLMIEANVIHSAYKNGVKRLLFLGSTCIYPKLSEQPMKEDVLLTGALETTNEPYALAKISGIKLCESYNRQFGTDFRSIMPTNLYGPWDNFHLENSHVIPAIMRKFHLAKCLEQNNWEMIRNDLNKNPIESITKESSNHEILSKFEVHGVSSIPRVNVKVWGSGRARREFLYVDDMATASLFLLESDKSTYQNNTKPMLSHVNAGTGVDVSIKDLVEVIKKVVGYRGDVVFDTTRPDGPPRKLVDATRLKDMGWEYDMNLENGLKETYKWYIENLVQ